MATAMCKRRVSLTVVSERVPVAEVDERRERLDAVPFGELRVLQFHHVDAVQVALIICRDCAWLSNSISNFSLLRLRYILDLQGCIHVLRDYSYPRQWSQ